MNTRKVLLLAIFMVSAACFVQAQTFKYIGAGKCKMCHNTEKSGQQFKIWSESKHAGAFLTLSGEKAKDYAKKNHIADASKEPKCLKCHSTAAMAGSLAETVTVEEGVSCESCHGPGSAYKSISIMKDLELSKKNGLIIPDQKTCEKCHNKENPFYKPFDYKAGVAKIAHPRPKS